MPETAPRHDAYAAFRVPAYRRFMIGSVLVQIGTSGQTLAIGFEMWDRTRDPLLLGMIGLVMAIPMLVLTLPAGYLADVLDRRRLMIASMILTSLTSLGLAAFSYFEGSIYIMFMLLFLDSCALRLGWPARAALLPALVPRDVFENAVKWRTSLGQISGMVGPVTGGLVIAYLSTPMAYVISALSTTCFIFVLLSIAIPKTNKVPRGRMLQQVAEGVAFVWRQKMVLGAVSLDLFAVLLGGAVYLLPIFATEIIDLSKTGLKPEEALGLLRAAPAAGAVAMALLLAHAPPFKHAGRTMLLAVAGFGAATIVFGLSKNLWLSMAMLALTGLCDNVSVVVRHTLVQLATPDAMRGRVSAVNAMFISSSNEIGGFESGVVADWFGPIFSVVSGGVGTIVVVVAWAGLFPKLRKIGRLTDLEPYAEIAPVAKPGG